MFGMILAAALVPATGGGCGECASLWRDSKAMWETPKTYPIDGQGGADVKAMAVEGEPFEGRPTRFFAYWALPGGASPTNRVPGIVLVHGGGGTAFDSWVRLWTARGYAAIAMDNCGGFPKTVKELGGPLRHAYSGPNGYGDRNFALVDRPLADQWTYHAVSTVIRSHSFLRSLPEVDARRIGITGISWGGYLTACTAGVDDRFAFAVPVYGTAYLYDHSVWSGQMKALGGKGRRWDELWDAKNFLPAARMPVLWVSGSNDHFFPLDSLRRSCDLLRDAPRLAIRANMPHGHPPAGDPREVTAFADHFAFGRPAFPAVDVTRSGRELVAKWKTFGRKVRKAELISTASRDPKWSSRPYAVRELPFESGGLTCPFPEEASVFWVNITCDDGIVASSRSFQVQ